MQWHWDDLVGGWEEGLLGNFWRKWKLKAPLILSVGDGDGDAFIKNMGKEVHNEISFEYVEYVFYILAKH